MQVRIEKLVHGGQGLAHLPDGKAIFVWNALPGELVEVELRKSKKSFADGFASEVIEPSEDRISELEADDINLSVQPWVIMNYVTELEHKRQIIVETFLHEGVELPDFEVQTIGSLNSYRNKVEFSFWGDDDGIFYSHFLRASHRKIKLEYPYHDLIKDQIAAYSANVLKELNEMNIRAGDLKSLIVRCDNKAPNDSGVAGALFVKDKNFPKMKSSNLAVYYSNPKSPASVPTEKLYQNGSTSIVDTVGGKELQYDVLSFFQVNLPVFELALSKIREQTSDSQNKVDLYSGVGSIGIAIGGTKTLLEIDPQNIAMAKLNTRGTDIEVVHASAEKSLDYITRDSSLIVDPPRAGLHKDVTAKICSEKPVQICYLSCNPITQARDIKHLTDAGYELKTFEAYNFFPRTPHIETLAILSRSI